MPPKRTAAAKTTYTAAGALSDDSDLDDLFDELEEDEEDKKPKRKPNDIEAIVKGTLREPRHRQVSAKYLHDLVHQGNVELNPAYQRDVVWNQKKMIGLIQSLMLNYYIPPIIFAVEDSHTDSAMRVCIDGKQRCTSILWFMDGIIPFISPHTGERFWYNKFANHKSGKQLPDRLKQRFDMVQLFLIEYDDMSEEQQREIFQRVQMGVTLSEAEKLQARAGPYPRWILELDKKYITAEGTLGKILDWDMKRGRVFQNLMSFVAIARESTPSKIFTPTQSTTKKFAERADAPDQAFKTRVQLALSIFINIATNYSDLAFGETKTKRVAPVEFWFIGYLIYSRMGFLSVRALAEAIRKMRVMIRVHAPNNVSANTMIMGFLSEYIQGIPKKRKVDEIPAAEQYEGDSDVDEREVRAQKRARRAEDEDPTYNDEWTEKTIASPPKATTRGKAATTTSSNVTSAATTPVPQVKPLPSNVPSQPRPAPVNVNATTVNRNIAGLPTPRTSSTSNAQQPQQPQQPQQVYNQQPVSDGQQQYSAAVLNSSSNGQQNTNDIGNTSEQWRQYTEARVRQQYPQSFRPQQQQQQQQQQPQQPAQNTNQYQQYGSNPFYGR